MTTTKKLNTDCMIIKIKTEFTDIFGDTKCIMSLKFSQVTLNRKFLFYYILTKNRKINICSEKNAVYMLKAEQIIFLTQSVL